MIRRKRAAPDQPGRRYLWWSIVDMKEALHPVEPFDRHCNAACVGIEADEESNACDQQKDHHGMPDPREALREYMEEQHDADHQKGERSEIVINVGSAGNDDPGKKLRRKAEQNERGCRVLVAGKKMEMRG